MKVLDLFSGIGGFSLGLERAGMQTVAFCEIDPFCRKVLRKHWPDVPIYKDVKELPYVGPVDVVCGGFPCQPFSTASAGKRGGTQDDRYLWPAMLAVIRRHRPRWVIGENVAGIGSMALEQVVSDLEAKGYRTAPPFNIPACAVGHDHRRARYWFCAYSDLRRKHGSAIDAKASVMPERGNESGSMGAAHGVPRRVDRLRALGNAVVPKIPEMIGRAIVEIENA